MKSLKDLLNTRHIYDLLKKAGELSLEAPSSMTEKEWEIALAFGRILERKEAVTRIDSYLDPAFDDRKDLEELLRGLRGKKKKSVEDTLRKERLIGESLSKAEAAKSLIAEGISGSLLEEEVMIRYLLDAADPTIDILKDLAGRDLIGDAREVYSLDLPWKKSWAADWIKNKGYGLTEELKASKSRDQHRYVTGISVPEDVLALFRKIYTPDADLERRKRHLVKDCCELARSYYETAPADLVLEICRRYAKGDPSAPSVTMEELIRIAGETQGDFHCLLEHEGEYYIADAFIKMDLEDAQDTEKSLFYSDVATIREDGDAFCIPDPQEVLDFCRHGWWSEREPWQKARQWFREYFLDEQYIESIFPAMLSMSYGDGEQAEKRELDLEIYSMDDVEEQTDEKISMAVWFFMDDNTVSDLLGEMKEITLSVTEEAKENLLRILEECRSQTNKRCYMGHMSLEDLEKRRREVRQKA